MPIFYDPSSPEGLVRFLVDDTTDPALFEEEEITQILSLIHI